MADCVVVTGDRSWSGDEKKAVIRKFLEDIPDTVLIVEGGCQGVDQITADLCRNELQRAFLEIPAPWKKIGKPAGPFRNKQMLNLNPIFVVAFHSNLPKSKGTKSCVREALKRKIKVHQVNAKGQHRIVTKAHLNGKKGR